MRIPPFESQRRDPGTIGLGQKACRTGGHLFHSVGIAGSAAGFDVHAGRDLSRLNPLGQEPREQRVGVGIEIHQAL